MPDLNMPDIKKIVKERVASLGLEPAAEQNLAEELAQHLEDRYQELTSGGMNEEEACRKTAAELDDMYPLRRELVARRHMRGYEAVAAGDTRGGNFIGELWRDVHYVMRTARKNPWFALFVILTLALGIGANTTVFTVVNTLILNPLPVPNSSALAALAAAEAKSTSKSRAALP